MSVSTKSGTNAFHGTAYEYFRNQAMDTIDYFSKKAGAAKPADRQNQPGGNLGGPIVRNRAFFFADYEGTRITRGATRLTNVPTQDQRNGIFTSTIEDPATGLPFPNNTIPSDRIDPYAAAILALLPAPNQPGANNFFRTANLTDNADRLLTRGDWRPSAADSLFARYIYSKRQRDIPGAFGGVLDGTGTSAFGNQSIKTNAFVAGWTRVLSNRMVNEARFSWSQATSDAVQQSFGLTPPAAAQIPGMITNPIVAGGFPGISVNGFFGGSGLGRIGSPDFLPKFQHTNQFEYIDTLSWLRGNHALKFGADIMAPMNNHFLDVPATRGSFSFNGAFTGNALADFLLGDVQGFQLSNVDVVDQQHWATMFYAQDDWKASDRLTLNLGLRYDFMTPALEANNNETNFDPSGAGSLVFATSGSLANRTLVKPDKNNVAPRIGFVYKIDDKTLVRGGWGIYYNLFDRVGSEDQLALNLPGLVNTSLSSSTAPLFLLQQGIPAGFLNPPSLDPTQGQLKSIHVRAVAANDPDTSLQQASIGFQREFAGVVASADFVYTAGSNLATLVNLNQPLPSAPGANDAKGPRPYPNFGFIEWRADNGKSRYHGVDVGVEKRFDKGYAFGVAYTYGNSKDNASEQLTTQGSNSFPQNARDFTNWYGPSDYDVRNRVTTNFVVNLPLGHNIIARDWVVSGVYAARTGRPFTVNQGSNNVGQNMYGLPDMTGDPNDGPKTVNEWFDVTAFSKVPSGIYGNEVRNQVRGPGFQSFDLSLQRMIRFGGRYAASLRWDAFNLFNATNFGLPNHNIDSASTFGTITSLAGDPRIMQLSVRFTF